MDANQKFLSNQVNVAVQVLPVSRDHDSYLMVDKAIEVIQQSGVNYRVTPFETVMEGSYDKLMEVVKDVQQACYQSGASQVMCYVKIQSRAKNDVTILDKMEKYD